MPLIQIIEENKVGRDFIVGDIHGCFTKLECELYNIGFNKEKDRLFSVGDLIDRGPESEKAIEYLSYPWFFAVRGNHEQMAIDGYHSHRGDPAALHLINGGGWFYNLHENDQRNTVVVFGDLPIAMTVKTKRGSFGITHAEPCSNDWLEALELISSVDKYSIKKSIWGRDKLKSKDKTNIKNVDHVYCGHTPIDNVITLGNTTFLDTGAVYKGGRLTILQVTGMLDIWNSLDGMASNSLAKKSYLEYDKYKSELFEEGLEWADAELILTGFIYGFEG